MQGKHLKTTKFLVSLYSKNNLNIYKNAFKYRYKFKNVVINDTSVNKVRVLMKLEHVPV